MLYNKRIIKATARIMLCTLTLQLVFPAVSSALTSGPSQPEVQSFEPVGTTDMVDMFTGDFVYNIPLLDVEGYPVNISYHSGGDMEQEASWVGLGWNINPGVVNRTVRGMPDDFNGEQIGKSLNIKPEKNIRVGLGVGAEFPYIADLVGLGLNLDLSVNVSNYRGVSADISAGAGVNIMGCLSAGVNMGVGSQNGADIDYNAGVQFSSSQIVSSDVAVGVGFNMGQGYNTRSGLKDRTFGFSASVTYKGAGIGRGMGATVPIGVRNMIPVITNSTEMKMYRGQIKLGGEIWGVYPHASVYGMVSTLKYDKDGSRKGYGYLYAQNADDAAILDFTRDRDGMFNETMKYLPAGNMTYDIYSVSGQGTGGSFRPFRNDFGSVYDPAVSSGANETGVQVEVGIGNLFEIGTDITTTNTEITSGPWDAYKRPFSGKQAGSIYENAYFKQAGEATAVNTGLFDAIQGVNPMPGTQTAAIPLKKPGSETMRDPRANLISYFTADEAANYNGVATSTKLYSYPTNGFAGGYTAPNQISRNDGTVRKGHHISEIVQTQTDGRRYIYGLPAMNTSQSEATFAVDPPSSDKVNGLISYDNTDASPGNGKGRDNFFSETRTPAYAHSYLLTSVLSTDYVDIKGDGPTDDDFGSFTKFNYSLKNPSYGWKAPYGQNTAQHDPGFRSDTRDDKASVLKGTREQWMLHSIETKNFVAEFYVSDRLDARGSNPNADLSYKLDSICLYNKHDRFINGAAAVPVKTIIFSYNYSLCKMVANNINVINNALSDPDKTGKLTLTQISVRYGRSDRSMISPYRFAYGFNPNYNAAGKDRWGNYKPNDPNLSNADFPFVKQGAETDNYATAWALEKITLPSGGNINIQYESDDYAYVQDKVAMEMFALQGVGGSASFSGGNQLYLDKNAPNRYFYFNRRPADETPGMSLKEIYLKGQDILYYNFNTRLVDNAYEPVKGYADVEEVGDCGDGIHGYIKTKPVSITGGGASLNHVTYTAINFARYYLPHILFPGSDPDASGIANVLSGIQYAFSELVSFTKNPVKRMVEEGKAREVRLSGSFMRLNSPGLKKKGGGSRVKELTFSDNWNKLAGGNSQQATYGKRYEYTTQDQGSYGTISSGVASYEPQIGSDENPFRQPVPYITQSGSNWPPNDPVGVYQELPVGESLYPSPIVGYSRVTVKSIHQDEGRSSQGVDIYDFYTAKEFPIKAMATPLDPMGTDRSYSLFEQKVFLEGAQGYTLIFNDMHGKPKRTEHRIIKPSTGVSELVSYQQYSYFTNGGSLENNVPVVAYDPVSRKLKKTTKLVGMEADITIDSREKKEKTESNSLYLNLNVFMVGIFPVPLPFWFSKDFNFRNEFRSVVATKVVQQYGILKEVQSSQEGAVTTVRNEAFDPVTGQALITSVNNEFNDKEYSVTYPAYWGYKSMGPSYVNNGFEETFASIPIQNYTARIPNASMANYKIGDELLITYTLNGTPGYNNAWVTGAYVNDTTPRTSFKCRNGCYNMGIPIESQIIDTIDMDPSGYYYANSCYGNVPPVSYGSCGQVALFVKPRYKSSWPANGTLQNVKVKVVRSGAKNQLQESIQNYTGMDIPFDNNNNLKDNLDQLISISAREYSDTLTAILPRYDSLQNPGGWDSLNIYVNGTRQIKRLSKEYAYLKPRAYDSPSTRKAGLFSAQSLWSFNDHSDNCIPVLRYCIAYACGCDAGNSATPVHAYRILAYQAGYVSDYNFFSPHPAGDKNWVTARSVTQWSPWGYELENKDAIGNFTAAQYGYNQQLPVALAQNARQSEILSEGFEDYQLLQLMSNFATISGSPIQRLFSLAALSSGNIYGKFGLTGSAGVALYNLVAHTGKYCLRTTNTTTLTFKVSDNLSVPGQPRYRPFTLQGNKDYLLSYWFRPVAPPANANSYVVPAGMQARSNIIEGWQQVDMVIHTPPASSGPTASVTIPANIFVDDIRILPMDANMKAFVYHPVNQKLVATLDENNFASFYEYDQEGNLVRTKKETEKGIITVMESRSANVKK
ncbi:hypothetical protein [Taibaiella helva]|uniref:hypothetical protein n=1 Tax=Taibaiella helva TaxID=2301235 RepID=UPI000E591BE3|nr:hypothetical protein [Taibaiella helva]